MKIKVNFEREFPRPTFSGVCFAAFTVFLGVFLKTGYDYFDSKNQFLRNIKAISSDLNQDSQNLLNVIDAISYSSQLGRLDFISITLALLGIVIGFGAIFGFLHIKETSENIARTASETWIRENVERIKEDIVRKILKEVEIVKEAKQEARKDAKDAEDYKNL